MGSLHNFNYECEKILYLKKVYSSTVFVETGCFQGNTLSFAIGYKFKEYYSCDIDKDMIDHCTRRFPSSIKFFHCKSTDFLNQILPGLDHVNSIIFYLDAHLPEHDKSGGKVILDVDYNFPLEQELEIINSFRKNKQDVIIADDLRIYEDGDYTGGRWSFREKFNLNLDFLNKFEYHVKKYYTQEGYLLLQKQLT